MLAVPEGAYIGDYLVFLAACYPGRPDALRRRGASAGDIERLAVASGFPLPPYYVAFLEEFGEDTGLTGVRGDGQSTVAALLEHYADPIEARLTPPGGVVIATNGLLHARMILDDGAIGCFLGEPRVEYVMARSFRHLLYQETFLYSRSEKSVTLEHDDPTALADVTALLVRLGFELHWFSDAHGTYGESNGAWVIARAEEKGMVVWIGSRDPGHREAVRDALRTNLATQHNRGE